jgi:hypothetical protein
MYLFILYDVFILLLYNAPFYGRCFVLAQKKLKIGENQVEKSQCLSNLIDMSSFFIFIFWWSNHKSISFILNIVLLLQMSLERFDIAPQAYLLGAI